MFIRRTFAVLGRPWVLSLVAALAVLCASSGRAADATNQFLFVRLQLKGGEVTLVSASVVQGTLKPQPDSTEDEPLVISLEQAEGEPRWTTVIADPSIQRHEYEDPQQRGRLKAKLVVVDEVEFIVRAPLVTGARHLAVYRRDKPAQPAKAGQPPPGKKLISRIRMPQAVLR